MKGKVLEMVGVQETAAYFCNWRMSRNTWPADRYFILLSLCSKKIATAAKNSTEKVSHKEYFLKHGRNLYLK